MLYKLWLTIEYSFGTYFKICRITGLLFESRVKSRLVCCYVYCLLNLPGDFPTHFEKVDEKCCAE